MPDGRICPFMSFNGLEKKQDCWREKCALWIETQPKQGRGACSFAMVAYRLDATNAVLDVTNRQLSGIAAKMK